jgi:hypothetical protein
LSVSNLKPTVVFGLALSAVLAWLAPTHSGGPRFVAPARAQDAPLTEAQAEALAAYDKALANFKKILAERRAQIDAKQRLPNLPGQALYLARLAVMSTYKDLTDVLPSRIGRPNKFGVPPAYFDADIEPLIEEYAALFRVMQAPPKGAQNSETPFKDVVDLATAIARAQNLDAATAEAAGRISLGLFFAETNGNQNIGNARSNTYKGSLQTGVAEDRRGRAAWAALKPRIAALHPAVAARDDQETARMCHPPAVRLSTIISVPIESIVRPWNVPFSSVVQVVHAASPDTTTRSAPRFIGTSFSNSISAGK